MAKHPDLLSIGKVSKLKDVSIKSLRYYDRIGILTPAYVDKVSKYRYYTREQLYLLDAIRLCLTLGIPLKDLNKYVQEDKTVNLQNLLYDGKELAEQRLREIQDALSNLQDTLANLAEVADTTAVNIKPVVPSVSKKSSTRKPAASSGDVASSKAATVSVSEHTDAKATDISEAAAETEVSPGPEIAMSEITATQEPTPAEIPADPYAGLPIYPKRHLLAVPMESDISPKYFGQYILKLFVTAQKEGLQVGYPSAVIYHKTHAGVKRYMAMQIRMPEDGSTPFIADNEEGIIVFSFPEGPCFLEENTQRIPFSDPALLSSIHRSEAESYFARGDILVEEDCMDPQLKEAGIGFLLMIPVL